MTKIKLKDTDLCLIVNEKGEQTIYIPNKEDIGWKSLHSMLKEIRKIEVVFTELVNETYKEEKGEKIKQKVGGKNVYSNS